MLSFIGDKLRDSLSKKSLCPVNHLTNKPNKLFQQWNLDFRRQLNILNPQSLGLYSTNEVIRIVVLQYQDKSAPSSLLINQLYDRLTEQYDHSVTAAVNAKLRGIVVDIRKVNIASMSLIQVIRLVLSSSILIGTHGSGINTYSMHMSLGTKYCCGVIELFPNKSSEMASSLGLSGYRNTAQSMGIKYQKIEKNVYDMKIVVKHVEDMMQSLTDKPSCILPEVVEGFNSSDNLPRRIKAWKD